MLRKLLNIFLPGVDLPLMVFDWLKWVQWNIENLAVLLEKMSEIMKEAAAGGAGIAARIAKQVKARVTAINRPNVISAFYRSNRYSRGAKELEDAGTPMLSVAGMAGPIVRLGKVDEASLPST